MSYTVPTTECIYRPTIGSRHQLHFMLNDTVTSHFKRSRVALSLILSTMFEEMREIVVGLHLHNLWHDLPIGEAN
jgi:hypothetical protein